MEVIEVEGLVKRFPNQTRDVLNRLTFAVPAQQCVSLLGPSGCGKTTLLRLLMGIEQPTSGTLTIAPTVSGRLSYVFQEPRLVPWRTSLENVLLPLELSGAASASASDEATALLTRLGLGERLAHFPRELSGGMQMRVALARALITKPKVLLLDEPFAALDERTRFRLQDLLLELRARLDLQYVFVTHSISEAVYLGDRVLLMNKLGQIDIDRRIEFATRTQTLKLTPAFNDAGQRVCRAVYGAGARRMKATLRDNLPAWMFLLALLAIWQTVVGLDWVAAYLLPAPSDIYADDGGVVARDLDRDAVDPRFDRLGARREFRDRRDARDRVLRGADPAPGDPAVLRLLPDRADHRDRAAARDLVRLRRNDRQSVRVHRVAVSDSREHADRPRRNRSAAARNVSALQTADGGR